MNFWSLLFLQQKNYSHQRNFVELNKDFFTSKTNSVSTLLFSLLIHQMNQCVRALAFAFFWQVAGSGTKTLHIEFTEIAGKSCDPNLCDFFKFKRFLWSLTIYEKPHFAFTVCRSIRKFGKFENSENTSL